MSGENFNLLYSLRTESDPTRDEPLNSFKIAILSTYDMIASMQEDTIFGS